MNSAYEQILVSTVNWTLFTFSQVFFNSVIPDHDADAFQPPCGGGGATLGDRIIDALLGGFRRWDALYFLHVAERGYTFENCLAFLPLFPLTAASLARAALAAAPASFLALSSLVLVSSTALNVVYFVVSAVFLSHLGRLATGSTEVACVATMLYCFNPASVFFSAAYSESMFAAATFCGLILCEKDQLFAASVVFGLGAGTRANGVVSAGFVVYFRLRRTLASLPRRRGVVETSLRVTAATTSAAAYACICVAPFLAYQYYAYGVFCARPAPPPPPDLLEFGRANGYVVAGDGRRPLWCDAPLPLSYSHVQREYWDVGFLRYYRAKQIPNFVLAAPALYLCGRAVASYVRRRWEHASCLGFRQAAPRRRDAGFYADGCFVYVAHCATLLFTCAAFAHVQVSTRLLCSSSPVIYWYCAQLLCDTSSSSSSSSSSAAGRRWRWDEGLSGKENATGFVLGLLERWRTLDAGKRFVVLYFISYFVVGIAMHCNFLPWT
ncbi:PREDICTED: GPI mannosyltransferase 2-like [Priapulus caudatus]|uniref:GPI mannosyltransferase 2 n=1 Tax=Priapulus caudatus TaxID=37621 RepID=A0ABM1EUZ8_PRICU|nr:PREDICTED: GPI mannosyltransferase 2-like [Priapulus caudatus]